MRFERLDLNLLVALDALLSQRSVSLAADRLCLSQSATSSALGRLREYFNDDLLVLKGRQMVLTARAEELIEPTRLILEQIRNTITVPPEFNPMTSERHLRIMASDYVTEVLLGPALRDIDEIAPSMKFEVLGMRSGAVDALERGQIDILITLDMVTSHDHPRELMYQDDHVVIGDRRNPAMSQPMTAETYLSLRHVTVHFDQGRIPAFEDWYMRRRQKQRKVDAIAPSFASMISLILGTNRIGTIYRKMAERMAQHFPVAIAELPFEIPNICELAQWNLANNSDPAIRWFIERLKEVHIQDCADFDHGQHSEMDGKVTLEFQSQFEA